MQEATTATASTQPAATTSGAPAALPAPLVLQPVQSFHFPNTSQVVCDISPDGKTVFVVQSRRTIDAWDVATYWWPEVAIGISLLALLWIASRIANRKQALGQPHCRQCNYLLQHLTETRCPECGLERATENPRRGRRRSWRLAIVFLLMLAYAAMARYGTLRPLRNNFADWFDWPMDAWGQRAQTTMRWMNDCWINCCTVYLQSSDGSPPRILEADLVGEFHGITRLQSGKSLVIWGEHDLVMLDAATGDISTRVHLGPSHGVRHPSTRVKEVRASAASDEPVVWVLLNTGEVRRVRLLDNTSTVAYSVKDYDKWPLLDNAAANGRVVVPQYQGLQYTLILLDEPPATLSIPRDEWMDLNRTALSPDLSAYAMTVNSSNHGAVEVRSFKDGATLSHIELPAGTGVFTLQFTPDGRRLVINAELIADIAQQRIVAQTSPAGSGMARGGMVSADGSQMAVQSYNTTGTKFNIDIFDINSIPQH